jgi:UPF0755 protein
MSVTGDRSSKSNNNDGFHPTDHVGRDFAAFPRSPAEALEPSRPPEPPEWEQDRRMHPVLAFFNALFLLLFGTAVLALILYYFVRVQFDRPGPLETSTVIVIPKGEGVGGIAERLKHEGVIADRGLFMTSVIYFTYLRGTGTLKAGEYEFRKFATLRQVLDTLVEGKSIEHKVTFAEGLTSYQIVERLRADPDLKGDILQVPAEGTLLPDTYRFQMGDTRQDIIERMEASQKKFSAKLWEERDPDIAVETLEEAIILASIVEKETGRADERPRVAGVFHNRLRKKMRLQSDPTIIYGVSGGKGYLEGPILQSHLEQENPYNTYKIDGLPPTPIANPGRAAIEAVLKPAKTDDLYFVADGTGGHAFAPSLDGHNQNVARWRQIERERREKERAEAAAAAAAAAAQGADQAAPDGAQSQAAAPAPAAPPLDLGTSAETPPGVAEIPPMPGTETADVASPPPPAAEPAGPPVPMPRRNPNR